MISIQSKGRMKYLLKHKNFFHHPPLTLLITIQSS